MKNAAYTAIAMLALMASMALVGQAQTSGSMKVVANIPFDFHVGQQEMKAGRYVIRQVNASSDRAVLEVASQEGDATTLVQMNSVRVAERKNALLIFNRYGSQYFLSIATLGGTTDGWQAPKSRAERGIAKELGDLGHRPATVALIRR